MPFLTPSDDLSHKSAPKTAKTLTEQGLEEVRNCLLPSQSVCVSCIGSDLGKVVMTIEPTVTNQQFNSIIPNKNFNADFVYYLMTLVGGELNYFSKTSTAVPIINKSSFSNYEVEVPDLEMQKKIASILSALDDKIELNRRINDNLEEQAQALFRSWFVDFEPWGGVMPEDWSIVSLSDIAVYLNGLAMQKFPATTTKEQLPVLKIKELGQGFCDENSDLCSRQAIGEKYVIADGDVIFSWSGTLMVKV
ncbi:MAG: restriction endonuclease subunit S [Alistipes indistinctus]